MILQHLHYLLAPPYLQRFPNVWTAVLSSGCVETSVQVPPLEDVTKYSFDVGCTFDGRDVRTRQSDVQSIECECTNL